MNVRKYYMKLFLRYVAFRVYADEFFRDIQGGGFFLTELYTYICSLGGFLWLYRCGIKKREKGKRVG